MQWGPCLKQQVTCTLLFPNGKTLSADNICKQFEGQHHCARVIAGCKSGEGYEMCGPPVHAEEAVLARARELGWDPEGAVAFLEGHTYYCPDCQHKLVAAGVRCLNICES